MTKEEAIKLYNSNFWEGMNYEEIAKFQLIEDRLCIPFPIFHESIEKALNRPVFTHEFVINRDGLINELFNGEKPPSLLEIINMIPAEKRLVIGVDYD